jgi:tetratricopeptide (TPR) repeat protein
LAKKSRRKELRQPDEFVSFTMKAGQWVRDHQRLVIFVSVAVVVIVVAVALTVQLTGNYRVKASEGLWTAVETGAAPVVDPDREQDIPANIRKFDSVDERSAAAIKAFKVAVDENGKSTAGQAARLALAALTLEKGEYPAAHKLYESFLDAPDGLSEFEGLALEGVGYCLEGQKNYDQALAKYRQLEKISDGDYQDVARYHQARMLEKLNKRDEALDLYRGVVRRADQATEDTVTNLFARDRAEARLALLDPGADVLRQRSKGRGADLLRQVLGQQGALPQGGLPRPPRGGAEKRPE